MGSYAQDPTGLELITRHRLKSRSAQITWPDLWWQPQYLLYSALSGWPWWIIKRWGLRDGASLRCSITASSTAARALLVVSVGIPEKNSKNEETAVLTFMRRASIGRLRIIRCPIRYPARTVKQWVSVKCSASCSHSDFCCLLSAAVRRRWCSPGDFMRTAVVLSRPSSVRWTRLLQTNVDVIPFFFLFTMNCLILCPLSWVQLPGLSALLLF